MNLRNTLLAGALTLLATASTSVDARRDDLDHVGLYNFVVEIDGEDVAAFSSVRKLDGHGGDGPALVLQDGVLLNESLLWAWSDQLQGVKDAPKITLVELDAKGGELATMPLDLRIGGAFYLDETAVLVETVPELEQAATEVEPDDEYGIVIWVIYVGSDED